MSSTSPGIRCAIYTRKSSEEGLDQTFNSLDAQYEAAAAYILSQRHEGWRLAKGRYDDGGISGGTLKRPALQKLLKDIEDGRIDMVVVYKIDRLTRSLTDFAKLVDRFDDKGCSFVSITQAFNTSTSMGRLTLNVLLSFAQFEREVTAERIRDKIAASKKKGLWMGGYIPIGYDRHLDPQTQTLVINEAEAQTVRRLFALYEELGSASLVAKHAKVEGLRSKRYNIKGGRTRGGSFFSRGQIYYLLRNPIYAGLIRHRDRTYPGQHGAIIDPDQWQIAQQQVQNNSGRKRGLGAADTNKRISSPLAGKLFDETGDRLTPSHANKSGRRYRYYVSHRLVKTPDGKTSGWRLPAAILEQKITDLVKTHLLEKSQNYNLLARADASQTIDLNRKLETFLRSIGDNGIEVVTPLIASCRISPGKIEIDLSPTEIATKLKIPEDDFSQAALTISKPLTLRRRGVEARLISGDLTPQPDVILIAALRKAHRWVARIKVGELMQGIAKTDNHAGGYMRSRIRLAFLSPKIQSAIIEGTQPPELTLERLIRIKFSLDWSEQERRFGFVDSINP